MKHDVNELFRIFNGTTTVRYATKAYVEANNIPTPDFKTTCKMEEKGELCAFPAIYITNKKPAIHDVDGIRVAYMYGEKTWFDTAEELNAHREVENEKRAIEIERNKIIKEINEILKEKSLEQLEMILTKI